MATAAPNQNLPLLYSALEPLNSSQHGNWKIRRIDKSPNMAKAHAVPATVEEFPLLQRHFPIVFSVGDNPIPLALMGLNEGVNVFVEADGTLKREFMEEIKKSWEEYVGQVGAETARGTPHFRDALNEILAKGQNLF